MNILKNIKEKQTINRNNNIEQEAVSRITPSVYKGELYIAFDGFPLVIMDKGSTSEDLIQKLNTVRNSYINYRQHEKY